MNIIVVLKLQPLKRADPVFGSGTYNNPEQFTIMARLQLVQGAFVSNHAKSSFNITIVIVNAPLVSSNVMQILMSAQVLKQTSVIQTLCVPILKDTMSVDVLEVLRATGETVPVRTSLDAPGRIFPCQSFNVKVFFCLHIRRNSSSLFAILRSER